MPKPWLVELSEMFGTTSLGLEPNRYTIWFDTEERVILADLEARATTLGYTVHGYGCINNEDDTYSFEGIPPMPVHVDTGDEIADHARYTAAKAQWVSDYPQAYAFIMDPDLIGTPHVK